MQLEENVAVVHDWFPTIAGGERVVEQMLQICPNSTVYTLFDFLEGEDRDIFNDCPVQVSGLNKLPFVQKYYRHLLLMCTRSIENFDVTGHDIVLSSSASLAKGVISTCDQVHVSYVHSPARYAWDLMHVYLHDASLSSGFKSLLAREMLHRFRIWDMRTVNNVDYFIANSNYIKKRIRKIYRRDAEVIYPPVNTDSFSLKEDKDDFYLIVSRLVPYKKVDLVVQAFSFMPDKKLVVIGDGPQMQKVKAEAHKNIEILGYQPRDVVIEYMQKAKAFIFPALEDFGIVPLEAQACGTPVIAFGDGGSLETVKGIDTEKMTGVHFKRQRVSDIVDAVNEFEKIEDKILPENCREHALYFSEENFRNRLAGFLKKVI